MHKNYNPFSILPWLMALLFSTLLAACGGGGGQDPAPVVPPASVVVSVAVTPATSAVPINGVQAFVATATFGDGSTRDVSTTTNWSSGATSIATVGQATGVVTGVSAGTTVITATYEGKTSTAAVTVTAATLLSVTVTPASSTIAVAGVQPFVATANYSDGTTRDVTKFASWSSGTVAVGTVVQTTGVVTGVTSGSSLITVNFGGKSGTAGLVVSAATLSTIAITPLTAALQVGGSQNLRAMATYSDGSVADITTAAVWASSAPLVASVVANTGVTTGVSAGSAVVTALSAGKSASATVTVAAVAGRAAVNLGSSGNFVVLAKTGISTTGATAIVGDIGVSPSAASFITGFGLIADATNTFATSSLVTGKVYAADYAPPTPVGMTTAISDMQTAFTDAAGRTLPDFTELGAGNISGMTLAPGLYKWGSGVLVTGVGVTLSGGPDAVWIFQIAQDLTVANSAIITLSGGAQAKNVFWQVSGKATLGTAANFKGNLMSQTLISAGTGAVVTGRLLAQTAVTLDATRVTAP